MRGALFASTALVLPTAAPRFALAQVAPTTTPQGGQVVGGAATIAQGNASTTINQSSENAAINWQSFDVGAAAKVQFNQPNAAAIALNRVVGGNLSQINGQINANGQIILINQSGVVFGKGSQVNAESVVVSTSDIATSDFMAGKLNFTGAPKPGAQIINNGNITARDAGLVGLVAPQVANNGLITATLGRVVLAGGSAFTLDLYGDQLISLDVTQAVRAVDIGGKLVPALVINNGAILADGGKITLTAQDADALVTQLINAGGTIRADTVGAQTGTISVQGIGGNINIAGNLLARGTAAGTKGGAVEALTTGAVSVAPGAVIDVSGNAGGGDTAIGTDIARAEAGPTDTSAPKAAIVSIAAGATIHADATDHGNAGTVTVLSANLTTFDGAITDEGGPQGGNGGFTELSSDGIIRLSGTVLDAAINGQPGEILLDPATLVITTGNVNGGASSLSPTYIEDTLDMGGGIVSLSASSLLEVLSPLDLITANTTLELVAGNSTSVGNITIAAPITVNGSLYIDASGFLDIGPEIGSSIDGPVIVSPGGLTASNILLNAGSGMAIDALVSASGVVTLTGSGTLTEGSVVAGEFLLPLIPQTISGGIVAPSLTSAGLADGDVYLDNTNSIGSFGNFTLASGGTLSLSDAEPLLIGNLAASNATFISTMPQSGSTPFGFSITGTLDTGTLSLNSPNPVKEDAAAEINAGALGIFGPGLQTTYSLLSTLNTIGTLAEQYLNDLFLYDSHVLLINSNVSIANEFLFEGTGINETGTGAIDVPVFTATLGGDAQLTNPNTIATLAGISAAGSLALVDTELLNLTGNVTAEGIALTAPSLNLENFGLTAAAGGTLALTANAIAAGAGLTLSAPDGTVILAPLNAADAIDITSATPPTGTLAIGATLLDAIETSGLSEFLLGGAGQSGAVNLGDAEITSINLGTATLNIQTSGTIGQAAAILTLGTLAFDGAGYTEAAGATLTAGLIEGNGGLINGNVLLESNKNDIGTIANLTITGPHELAVQQTLALQAGNLNAATIALNAGGLALDNAISATQLTLDSTVAISQSSGVITATTLSGDAGGAIILGELNAIGTLGAVSAGGNILLDSNAFAIAGQVSTTGALILEGSGATELAGSGIQAAALTSDGTAITGAVNLTAGSNTIATLTNFAVSGTNALNLTDTGALTLGGTVSAGNASISAATLALNGALNVTGLLALGSQNGIIQTGGTLDIGTLASAGAVTGGVTLNGANSIRNLAAFTVDGGDFTLNTAGTLDITGLLDDAGHTAQFTAAGLAETGAGAIDAATLAGTSGFGAIVLDGNNSIGVLGAFDAAGTFSLTDAVALTVTNDLTAAGINLADSVSLEIDALLTANESGVALAAPSVDIAAGGTVDLTGGGQVFSVAADSFANTGTIFAHTLAIAPFSADQTFILGSAPGDLDLTTDEANIIGLDALIIGTAAGHAAEFISIVSFSVSSSIGLVSLFATGLIEDDGLLDANAIAIGGGGFSQTSGGTVITNILEGGGVIDGNVSLGNATNLIGTLGPITLATGTTGIGTLALTDGEVLTLAGTDIAQAATLNAGGMDFIGNFSAATELMLLGNGNITETGGLITAGTLRGNVNGAITLLGPNQIGTLGAIDASGNIVIGNAQFLDIAGLVSTTGTITLENTAGITEIASGTLAAAVFNTGTSGINGDLLLTNGNDITSIADISLAANHTLAVSNAVALTLTGTIIADDATLSAPSLALDGTLEDLLLALASTSGISQSTAGIIDATTLISLGEIGGNVALTGANTIATLTNFLAAGQKITLNDTTLLSIGFVTADDITLTATGLAFTGNVDAVDTLALGSSAGISQSGGVITTGDLISDGPVSGNVDLGGQNAITAIGAFTVAGTLAVTDAGTLGLAGPIAAGAAIFTANSIAITGDLAITNTLALTAPGGVDQTAGTITAGSLTNPGAADGNVFLLAPGNAIAAIGVFAVGAASTFALADTGLLTVTGPLSGGTITLSSPTIAVTGAIDATLLGLVAADGIAESGAITATTLTSLGETDGNVTLNGTNSIATLAGFYSSSDLLLADAQALTLAGTISATVLGLQDALSITQAAGGAILVTELTTDGGSIGAGASLTSPLNIIRTLGPFISPDGLALDDSSDLIIDGLIDISGGTLTLGDAATISQTGGSIIAAALASDGLVGAASFSQAGNQIDTIANFSALGLLLLDDSSTLAIAGNLNAGTFALFSDSIVTETTGLIDVGIFSGSIAGNTNLTVTQNSFGTIENLTIGNPATLDVADSFVLTLAGTILTPGGATFNAPSVVFDGVINAGSILALTGSTVTTEGTNGDIIATILTSDGLVDGNVFLLGTNSIGTIENFTVGPDGTFALNNGELLTVAGPLVGGYITLSATALDITGTITAANILDLQSSGDVTGAGVIDTGLLTTGTGSITGNLSLTGANAITTIGAMSIGEDALISDAIALTIAGLIKLLMNTDTLALQDEAGITETTGGVISAATLTSGGATDGNVELTGQNTIATLGDFAAGTLALTDTVILTIAGTVNGTLLALDDASEITETGTGLLDIGTLTSGTATDGDIFLGNSLNTITDVSNFTINMGDTLAVLSAGVMFLTGTIAAPNATFSSGGLEIDGLLSITNTLALGSTGAIAEAATGSGVIEIANGTLVSYNTIAGPVALLTDNQIGTIGAFAVDGDFTFRDGTAYAIAGLISLPGSDTLTLEGFGFSEVGAGGIDAGTLTSNHATIAGSATMNGANSIANLTNFYASGNVFLADAQALTLSGTISATTLGLLDSFSIAEATGGAIQAIELTSDGGIVGTSAILNGTGNRIDTLGPFAAHGGLALYDAKTLLIDGNINLGGALTLADAQSVEQTGGTITAAALSTGAGSIGGSAAFGEFGNQITAVSDFTTSGSLFLEDDVGLSLTGNINAATGLFIFTNNDDITQTGGKIVTGSLALGGDTISLDLKNTIAALGLVSAADLLINGVYAVTGTVSAGAATITSPTSLAISGDIIAGGSLLLAAATLAQTGGTIEGANIQLYGASLVSLGGVISAGNLAITSPHSIDDEALSLTASGAQFNGGTGVTLNGANSISGALLAQGALILQTSGTINAATIDLAGGSILQSGGIMTAASLVGSVAQDITLASVIDAGSVDLTAGNITETGAGALTAATLTLSAASIALSGAANITSNASINGGDVSLNGIMQAGALDVTAGNFNEGQAGRLAAQSVTITAAGSLEQDGYLSATSGDLSAGTINLGGTSRFTDILFLKAVNDIFAPGNVSAGTLTGTLTGKMTGTNQVAFFTGLHNEIGTIGSFVMGDSVFELNDAGPLVLDGPLVADAVSLDVTGLLTLEGSETGGLFIHGQTDPKTALTPQSGDSIFYVTGTTAGIVQTGTFYVDSGPLAGQYPGFYNMRATLFFILSPAGNISFEPAPPDGGGLFAPSIAAVFSPGAGGTISGNVDLLSLLLLNGKATNLTGMLDGLNGEAASGKGNVNPFPKPVYQFNACPIGSVNCIILPVETLPPGNPLQNFDIAQHKKKRLDKNVALPGVATRDF
jgi:filamentous hemagglutinin family protein